MTLGVVRPSTHFRISEWPSAKENPQAPDNNFAYAMCLAVEKLSRKAGGLKDPAAYQILVKIAAGNYLRTVKTKALQVLDELKSSK